MPYLAPPSRRRSVRRVTRAVAGPFIGIRDSLDPLTSNDPKYALAIENMYPLELDKPSAFVGRPGFDQAGSQLGATNKRTGQLVYQFTKLDGTEITLAIVGGQGIYTYNWSTGAWSQVVTVANLTTASITLSETSRCYAVTFTDKLIVSDGVNTPWMWDGTSGAGGLTSLTECPVLYGQPTVYYSKLWGIKNAERNVLVYSEENDPTIGYENAAYSDSWQLATTEQEAFTAIVGTNERLYYFRGYSTGAVSGAVTPEFQSDGTREGVDPTVGTLSPAGVVLKDSRLFFVDAQCRPHFIAGQSPAVPLWQDIKETLRGIDTNASAVVNVLAVYDPDTQLVLLAVASSGQTNPNTILVVNPVLNLVCAVWRGFTVQAMAVVKNGEGEPRLMHLSADGYAYDHGSTTGVLWDDELNAGTQAIRHAVEGPHMLTDLRDEKRYNRVDVGIRADADATAIALTYTTPYGASSALSASVTSNVTRWDEFNWDEAPWAGATVEQHLPFGINALGRWVRPRIAHSVLGEQFGVEAFAVEYQAAGDNPLAP